MIWPRPRQAHLKKSLREREVNNSTHDLNSNRADRCLGYNWNSTEQGGYSYHWKSYSSGSDSFVADLNSQYHRGPFWPFPFDLMTEVMNYAWNSSNLWWLLLAVFSSDTLIAVTNKRKTSLELLAAKKERKIRILWLIHEGSKNMVAQSCSFVLYHYLVQRNYNEMNDFQTETQPAYISHHHTETQSRS